MISTTAIAGTGTGAAERTLLKLGRTFITRGALEAMTDAKQTPLEFLLRHIHRDWGEVDQEDKKVNDMALHSGMRILSAYRTAKGIRIWITTDGRRTETRIMLPEEW